MENKFIISQRPGDTWFPLIRGTVREGSGKLALSVETPPPSAPPLGKGRTVIQKLDYS